MPKKIVLIKTKDSEKNVEEVQTALRSALDEHFFIEVREMHRKAQKMAEAIVPSISIAQTNFDLLNKMYLPIGTFNSFEKIAASFSNILKTIQPIKIDSSEKIILPRSRDVLPQQFPRVLTLSDKDVDRVAKRAAEIICIKIGKINQSNVIFLILDKDGNLYRKDDHLKRYEMTNAALRLKILKFFVGKNNFIDSEFLEDEFDITYKSLTDAIGKINTKARINLYLPKGKVNRFIISKAGSGYMLNPNYPIEKI